MTRIERIAASAACWADDSNYVGAEKELLSDIRYLLEHLRGYRAFGLRKSAVNHCVFCQKEVDVPDLVMCLTSAGWFPAHRDCNLPAGIISPGEAVFGFIRWLITKPRPIEVGIDMSAAPIAKLARLFCEVNDLSLPDRYWHDRLKVPEKFPDD